jgi:hypothetical protein
VIRAKAWKLPRDRAFDGREAARIAPADRLAARRIVAAFRGE